MRAVRPEDGIALEDAVPSVVAGDVHPFAGAILRLSRGDTDVQARGGHQGERDRMHCRHFCPSGLVCAFQISRRHSADSGSPRGAGQGRQQSRRHKKMLIFLNGLDKFCACPAAPLAKTVTPLQERAQRRDGRVAEGARLESVCAGNRTVGSNPTLSASDLNQLIVIKEIFIGHVPLVPKSVPKGIFGGFTSDILRPRLNRTPKL
jgi:hypothetical protein